MAEEQLDHEQEAFRDAEKNAGSDRPDGRKSNRSATVLQKLDDEGEASRKGHKRCSKALTILTEFVRAYWRAAR